MLEFAYIIAGIGAVVYALAAYMARWDGVTERRRGAFIDAHWTYWKRNGWNAEDRAIAKRGLR